MTFVDAQKHLYDAAREFTNRWEHAVFKEPHRLGGEEWDEAVLLKEAALTFARARDKALGEEADE